MLMVGKTFVCISVCVCVCVANIDDVVLGIAHRGRLNLLTCLLKYPPVVMFQKVALYCCDSVISVNSETM